MTQTPWPRTIWSEARQINALNGWRVMDGDHRPPPTFFARLRDEGREREAALFLAQALPRYEAVAWAASVIDRLPEAQPHELQPTMRAIRAWLDDPGEAQRRAVCDNAGPLDPPAAVTLCALAAFHTGGSIAPVDQPVAPPPRGATGRFAGAAVISATSLAADAPHQLRRALEDGERIAGTIMETTR